MSITIEEQRNKARLAKKANKPLYANKIKRFINGELVYLSVGSNWRYNKKVHKPPKILYGLNTSR